MTGRDEKRLPARWRWGAIGDPAVATLIMGQSPPGNTYNTDGRGLPFFQGKADFGEVFPTERVWCTAPKKIAEQGDILLSVRAPVGPTNLAARQCCIGRGLAALRGGRTALTSYLYYWFKSIEAWLSEQGEGSTFTAIGKERIESLKVPLPPLPVQERIVQILQKADEIRRKRREALELADKTLPALFLEMFGDPATNPKGWPTVPLGECASIRRGLSKRPSPKGNVPIVRIKNLTLSGLDLSWSEMIEASPREIERGRLLPGDIVFSPLNGSIEHLAKSDVFAAPENETWVLDSNLCAFRANESVVRKGFLAAFLRLPSTLDLLRGRLAVRTSGGQWLLKTSTLQKVAVPVPPLQQQDYFIQQAEHYSETRKKYALAFREAELCFTSLMSQAFTGELTAEWEAANAEWIAAQKALHERLPRLLVLALLMEKAKRARRAATEVLVTALMKYAFLVQMEGNAARRRLYHFVPYHYGPFAKELYADLQALQDEGLVRVESDPDEDKTRIVLIDPAKAQEALGELPDDLKEDAATIIETYGHLDHNALLRAVYEKYPSYARKSRLKRGKTRN